MPLRTRMMAGLTIIIAVLVAAGALVLGIQSSFLTKQLDQRMARQLVLATSIASGETTSGAGNPTGQPRRARGLADMYIGILTDSGLQTISTPETDPGLTPVITPEDLPTAPATPTTLATNGGRAHRMRVITAALPTGSTLVFGGSMGEIDAALTGLRLTLAALGGVVVVVVLLVFWWLRRLGLDPILRVTRVANCISAGDTSQRVETFPPGTEAHDLGTAFNQLVDTNEATQAQLRRFVADASHELRTPLVTLKGYASLYGSGGLPDEESVADAMRRIKSEANRMSRLVEDLLLLAELDKADANKSGLDKAGLNKSGLDKAGLNKAGLESGEADNAELAGLENRHLLVDLVPILSGLASDLAILDPQRTVTLSVPNSAVVVGDPDQLTQVFSGLTANAMRHTPAGTPIELSIIPAAHVVRVEVTDHGAGIAAADQVRVFDRFYRTDAARARAPGGSGLGLAIAAAIVKAHGGSIGVSSPPGQGATFWVELHGAGAN